MRRAPPAAPGAAPPRRHMAAHGYAGTSMDALTAEAGLTRGALYHHFGGKPGLLEAVVREIGREVAARVEAVWSDDLPPLVAFRRCCRAWLDIVASDAEVRGIVYRDAPAVLGEAARRIDAESSIGPIREALEELAAAGAIRPADPEALARLLNGAMVDAAFWIAASADPAATAEIAGRTLDLLIEGLAPAGAAGPAG